MMNGNKGSGMGLMDLLALNQQQRTQSAFPGQSQSSIANQEGGGFGRAPNEDVPGLLARLSPDSLKTYLAAAFGEQSKTFGAGSGPDYRRSARNISEAMNPQAPAFLFDFGAMRPGGPRPSGGGGGGGRAFGGANGLRPLSANLVDELKIRQEAERMQQIQMALLREQLQGERIANSRAQDNADRRNDIVPWAKQWMEAILRKQL